MVSWMICRLVVLVFGMLYPAYASYKAVKTKNIREYVRWMMYWIVFALFMAVETFTDIFISWFPFYYEIKMAFVLWLLSPYTRGASMLYRKFVHPSLSRHEKEIDTYIVQAKERSYETVLSFGKRGLNIAASAAVQAATKSQGALAGRLRSFSMQDLRTIPDGPAPTYQDPLYLEDQVPRHRPPIGYRAGGLRDSDTDNECWSDTEVAPQPPARPREKPLGRSQSLRVIKRKPLAREGTSRSLKVRTRKKTAPSDVALADGSWPRAGQHPQCTKAGWAYGSIYCLPRPSTFPDVGPEPSPDPWKMKPKGHPALFLPSCPLKYLTAFSKACVCVGLRGVAHCTVCVDE
uniref:Receptor expression-enhancing protein n=1 Tax=Capra hircus TaxID=9925 RepID=A0A8C2P4T1_CAPHI